MLYPLMSLLQTHKAIGTMHPTPRGGHRIHFPTMLQLMQKAIGTTPQTSHGGHPMNLQIGLHQTARVTGITVQIPQFGARIVCRVHQTRHSGRPTTFPTWRHRVEQAIGTMVRIQQHGHLIPHPTSCAPTPRTIGFTRPIHHSGARIHFLIIYRTRHKVIGIMLQTHHIGHQTNSSVARATGIIH